MRIKTTLIMAVIFVLGCRTAASANPLCSQEDNVIFSCSTSASKTVSLCMNEKRGLITYVFGKPSHIEMSYSSQIRSNDGFFVNHYFRARVDYTRISFATSGYKYSLFRNYDADESNTEKYGVIVSRNSDDSDDDVQIECRSHVIDNMEMVIKLLKCDNSSALGCS